MVYIIIIYKTTYNNRIFCRPNLFFTERISYPPAIIYVMQDDRDDYIDLIILPQHNEIFGFSPNYLEGRNKTMTWSGHILELRVYIICMKIKKIIYLLRLCIWRLVFPHVDMFKHAAVGAAVSFLLDYFSRPSAAPGSVRIGFPSVFYVLYESGLVKGWKCRSYHRV